MDTDTTSAPQPWDLGDRTFLDAASAVVDAVAARGGDDAAQRAAVDRVEAEYAEAERLATTPVVGGGATIHRNDTAHPYVVAAIHHGGATVILRRVRDVGRGTGHAPVGTRSTGTLWDHVYTADELADLTYPDGGDTVPVHRRRNDFYRTSDGYRVTFGGARFRAVTP